MEIRWKGATKPIAHTIRSHRGKGNGLRLVLVVGFGEEDCRVRVHHAPENLATVRKIAPNVTGQGERTEASMETKRWWITWNVQYPLSLFGR